ncbi:hypothetical protein PoB_006202600 [Plakobranchus ocellatus]|uniref:Uncharacterized protein n=1 Tax=Plakobranchus ocellatus TaxID=259542 RepID=A0AAV4CV15_9GAST|nr:hypothetical protein PoB_006202600 [Plakobranchus ocellatus]
MKSSQPKRKRNASNEERKSKPLLLTQIKLLTRYRYVYYDRECLCKHPQQYTQSDSRPNYIWASRQAELKEAEAGSVVPAVGNRACALILPSTLLSTPCLFSLISRYFCFRRHSLAIWTKFMPQMIDQTQPTMTTKLTIWRKAERRLRQNALAGLPNLVWQPHKHVHEEMNVPEGKERNKKL